MPFSDAFVNSIDHNVPRGIQVFRHCYRNKANVLTKKLSNEMLFLSIFICDFLLYMS